MSYKKLQHIFENYDWKIWVVGGVALIALITFIQNTVVEHKIRKAQLAVMSAIDHEEQAIHQSMTDADKRDESVNVAFEKAMTSSDARIDSTHKEMKSLRQLIGMDKRK